MSAFLLSLLVIFIAELGDKTQLVALSLATRFNARVVLAGIFVATLAVHVVSAGLGICIGCKLPTSLVSFLAGLAFIAFGLWTLRGDCIEDGDQCLCRNYNPFWLVTITFFLAELGDKTMLSTVTLATKYSFVPVWLGSTIGMVISDGLAILVGTVLGSKLPERMVKIGAAVIFFGFGIYGAVDGGRNITPIAWIIGAVSILLLGYFFFRKPKAKAAETEPELETVSVD